MAIPSIFFNYSSDPNLKEINLTKSLLNVFESSKTNLFIRLLKDTVLEFNNNNDIIRRIPNNIICKSEVYLEEHGRVDAILRSDIILAYIECKHGTNKFTKSQLSGYFQKLAKENAQIKILILIANYYPAEKLLDDISDNINNIIFLSLTWDDIYDGFNLLKKDLKDEEHLDFFLLDQFQKYLLEMNVVTNRFSSEEAKILSNTDCDWSSISKPFKKKLKIYFDNLRNELVKIGFDEKSFNKISYEKSRFGSPTLKYKPPKFDKNRNIYLRFELSRNGKPTFLFEFVENEKNSKLCKNILNNKDFENKLKKVTFPRLIATNISQEKDKYNFGNYKELYLFDVTEDISKFNGKVGFILYDELDSEESTYLYETDELFNIVVEAFKQNKFIIDEYL